MSGVVFLAHLPMLRIAEEAIAFAGGTLWCLPFETYNALSLGAFEDHQKAYEATAPVFYRFEADLDVALGTLPDDGKAHAIELKIPTNNQAMAAELGLEFVLRFRQNLAERARAALLLAAPACGIPDTGLSATFVRLTDPGGFQVGNMVAATIRVQGDADQEYLFLPEAAGSPLSVEAIGDADRCLAIVDGLGQQPDLLAATRALMGATAPMLSAMDQLVLSVRAIEALLLPDITRGLGRTFAQRLSGLLGVDATHREALRGHARTLYDARSASLHGEAPRSPAAADTAAAQAHAEQLLAASIRRMAERSKAIPVQDQREALDAEPDNNKDGVALPLAAPAGLRRAERMLRPHSPIVVALSSGADMGAKDGTVSWSPLIGLQTAVQGALRQGADGVAIMTLNGEEMVSLEERDTQRDFIGQLRMMAEPAAVLITGAPGQRPETTMQGLAPLLRRRDLATVALRLAGFHMFYDPELLGVFVYQDSVRTRFPSVFRQTIEEKMRRPAEETFTDGDLEKVGRFLQLLAAYDESARHPHVDQVLRLFRHGFDQEFLPEIVRAALLLSAVEAMLGRFRKPQELERLVVSMVQGGSPEAAAWFQERGRNFRNTIAHGKWPDSQQDPQPMSQLIDVLRGLIPAFVQAWLAQPDRATTSPVQVFLAWASEKGGAWERNQPA